MGAIFKRKAYGGLLAWKARSNGSTALLVEGARRVGKTTLVSEFARQEYGTHLIIDFSIAPEEVKDAFRSYRHDIDTLFMLISTFYNVSLTPGDALVVFDEVQRFPIAREFIKHLVADGRYHYMETGSIISIKKNVQDIVIPSEEESLELHPMDFEEFCWAAGEEMLPAAIQRAFERREPLPDILHKKAERVFREYLLVGGMPNVVSTYLDQRNFEEADRVKRGILKLYADDIEKFGETSASKINAVFDEIPGQLSKHEKRFVLSTLGKNARYREYASAITWLDKSYIANVCRNSTDPSVGLKLHEQSNDFKCYLADTGLLTAMTFADRRTTPNEVYKDILFGKLEINEGMLVENLVAQSLRANGYRLFYYSRNDNSDARGTMEVDFLIVREFDNAGMKARVSPVEVKSTKKYGIKSLDKFKDRFGSRVGTQFVLHPKQLRSEGERLYLPLYMAFCL